MFDAYLGSASDDAEAWVNLGVARVYTLGQPRLTQARHGSRVSLKRAIELDLHCRGHIVG